MKDKKTLITIIVLLVIILPMGIYGTIKIIKGQVICVENLYYESAAIVIFFIKIGKYVEKLLQPQETKKESRITMEFLQEHGF